LTPRVQPRLSLDEQVLLASRGVTSAADMRSYIVQLRRSKLTLLADDLIHRVRCIVEEHPEDLLDKLSNLAAGLLRAGAGDDDALRTSLRTCLWELRVALEPHSPPESLRNSLEVVRSGLLDCPPLAESNDLCESDASDSEVEKVADRAVLRGEMHQLMVENILLEELRSFRLLEREINDAVERHYPGMCQQERHALYFSAACELGLDEYRVRSKTRLATAAASLRQALLAEIEDQALAKNVDLGLDALSTALSISLEIDLAHRRPAGEAMLLRPRMSDIPNFRVVSPSFLRGGQPSKDGVKWLQNCGVTLVIDLRGSDRGNQWSYPSLEEEDSENSRASVYRQGASLRVCNISIEDFDVPSFEQVDQFMSLITSESENGGIVFVHCKAGIGRTGTLVACWRTFCGEPVDDALAKESLYSSQGGGLRQESFVREYARQLQGK
jgi:Tyrosine phosphatase family